MPTYLYCLLATRRDPPGALTGIGGATVRALQAGDLGAWVATLDAPPPPEPAGARAHDAVVRAALATGDTPLPARFGQLFASDADCVAELQRRSAAFHSALQQVAGCVEMVVHLRLTDEAGSSYGPTHAERHPGESAGAGRRYLERIKARLRADREHRSVVDHVRDRIRAVLGGELREERVEIERESGRAVALAHLVTRGAVEAWRGAVDEARRLPGLKQVTVTGPYAPYSFVEADGRDT